MTKKGLERIARPPIGHLENIFCPDNVISPIGGHAQKGLLIDRDDYLCGMKVLYNVTVTVEPEIEQEWLAWLLDEHVPAVMETGCFQMYRVARLIEPAPPQGMAYTVQYVADSQEDLERYLEVHANRLRRDSQRAFGDRAVAFRSLMEIVS
jgi:hypothetical protein